MVRQQEIRALTGIRGIAAVYVMLYHFKISNFTPDFFDQFFRHGYLAVDLFFILSGFVMALTYQYMFKDGVTFHNMKDFMTRRFARIYPLYIIVTLIYICFYALFPNKVPNDADLSAAALIPNLWMIQAWGISPSIVSTGWSISTEFCAYLLFPILAIAIFYRGSWLPHLIALIGCIMIFILYSLSIGEIDQTKNIQNLNIWDGKTFAPLIRCIAEFAIGVWAYRLYNSQSAKEKMSFGILQKPFVSLIITALIGVLLMLPSTDLLVVILVPFFIISIAHDKSIVARFLGYPPIYFIGVISYSLYLCHLMSYWVKPFFVNELVEHSIDHPQLLALMLQIVISFMLAIVFYFGIEKPGRVFLRKFGHAQNRSTSPQV